MKPGSHLAIIEWIYSGLLSFYPTKYREEFADEMREVFSQSASDACREGSISLTALLIGELLDFPGSVLQAHMGIQNADLGTARHPSQPLTDPAELSWRELLLALAVFLLPAAMLLINQADLPTSASGLNAVALFMAIMVAAGFLRGTPLRSLPYFGVVLAIAGYLYLFQWVAGLVSPALISNFSSGPWDRSTYLLLKVFSNGMLWLMLFCLTLLVVALLTLFNRFQPLFRRVNHDWTLLSYILYGESAFTLLLLFESYRYEPSYAVASLLCLAAGGWIYLRSNQRRRRILSLVSGLTLAVWIAALGTWLSLPDARVSIIALLAGEGSRAAGQVLLAWVLMLLALLLPGLLSRLPVSSHNNDGYTKISL